MIDAEIAVRLKECERRDVVRLPWNGVDVNQIRQRSRRHFVSRVGERFIRSRDDSMIGQAGVRNPDQIALRHVASRAVVWRSGLLASRQWQRTTALRVTDETFATVIGRRLVTRGLDVRIMARDAA